MPLSYIVNLENMLTSQLSNVKTSIKIKNGEASAYNKALGFSEGAEAAGLATTNTDQQPVSQQPR